MSYKDDFKMWLEERPQAIKDLVAKYPPGDYTVKADSPYSITAPGSTVNIISYLEDGKVGVQIKAENKTPEAIEHEKALASQHGRSEEELQKMHETDVMAHVDPQWLELITNELL